MDAKQMRAGGLAGKFLVGRSGVSMCLAWAWGEPFSWSGCCVMTVLCGEWLSSGGEYVCYDFFVLIAKPYLGWGELGISPEARC